MNKILIDLLKQLILFGIQLLIEKLNKPKPKQDDKQDDKEVK